jgi:hypothetical protein
MISSLQRRPINLPRVLYQLLVIEDGEGLPLIAFHFYHEVAELLCAVEENLMRHARGNADNVTRGKLLPGATLNRAIAFFVRGRGFCADERAAKQERSGTGLHDEYVDFRFVPLGLAVGSSVGEQEILVGIGRKLLRGDMMRVGRGSGGESLTDGHKRRWRPVLKPRQRSLLRRHSKQGYDQQKQHEEFLHYSLLTIQM